MTNGGPPIYSAQVHMCGEVAGPPHGFVWPFGESAGSCGRVRYLSSQAGVPRTALVQFFGPSAGARDNNSTKRSMEVVGGAMEEELRRFEMREVLNRSSGCMGRW